MKRATCILILLIGLCSPSISFAQAEVLTVVIDILPGSDPNSINCRYNSGIFTAAILTTDTFDALTVDHTTVTLASASVTDVHPATGKPQRHEEDVDSDGDLDLLFYFRFGDTSLTCASTQATLLGKTVDGVNITGVDAVRMVPYGIEGCHEESHVAWKWEGQWMLYFTDGASGRALASYSLRNTEQAVYAEFEFLAGGFGLVYHTGPYGGFASIYIDDMDTPYTRLDMYAQDDQWQANAVLTVGGLDPDAEHVLRIVPMADSNPQSRGYVISIDRIDLPAFGNCAP